MLACSLLAMMVGCQSEAGYKVLTFFFEGVPPPGSSKRVRQARKAAKPVTYTQEEVAARILAARLAKQKFGVKHEPARDCSNCHQGSLGSGLRELRKPLPDLCYKCHENYESSRENLHGPVVVGECLFCHESHSSSYVKLQTAPQPDLCYKCHTRKDVALTDIHKDVLGSICTDCHDPHTGSSKKILRPLKQILEDIFDDPNNVELNDELMLYLN